MKLTLYSLLYSEKLKGFNRIKRNLGYTVNFVTGDKWIILSNFRKQINPPEMLTFIPGWYLGHYVHVKRRSNPAKNSVPRFLRHCWNKMKLNMHPLQYYIGLFEFTVLQYQALVLIAIPNRSRSTNICNSAMISFIAGYLKSGSRSNWWCVDGYHRYAYC